MRLIETADLPRSHRCHARLRVAQSKAKRQPFDFAALSLERTGYLSPRIVHRTRIATTASWNSAAAATPATSGCSAGC